MYLLKLIMWLSIYFILYIVFSLNTLISIFCFIIIIFFIAILLFQLYIEYITYLILLLYLGGILIFFLFTALMLNNEYTNIKNISKYSFENIIIFLFWIKSFFYITCLNYNLCLIKNNVILNYLPTYLDNNYFLKDIISNQGDIYNFILLYTQQYILLFLVGFILLFTMLGIIVITKK